MNTASKGAMAKAGAVILMAAAVLLQAYSIQIAVWNLATVNHLIFANLLRFGPHDFIHVLLLTAGAGLLSVYGLKARASQRSLASQQPQARPLPWTGAQALADLALACYGLSIGLTLMLFFTLDGLLFNSNLGLRQAATSVVAMLRMLCLLAWLALQAVALAKAIRLKAPSFGLGMGAVILIAIRLLLEIANRVLSPMVYATLYSADAAVLFTGISSTVMATTAAFAMLLRAAWAMVIARQMEADAGLADAGAAAAGPAGAGAAGAATAWATSAGAAAANGQPGSAGPAPYPQALPVRRRNTAIAIVLAILVFGMSCLCCLTSLLVTLPAM